MAATRGRWQRYAAGCVPLYTDAHLEHYFAWADRWGSIVGGNVGYVNQTAQLLFHGEFKPRRVNSRHLILRDNNFDPVSDLRTGCSGVWEWASDKTQLHEDLQRYFVDRKEDG